MLRKSVAIPWPHKISAVTGGHFRRLFADIEHVDWQKIGRSIREPAIEIAAHGPKHVDDIRQFASLRILLECNRLIQRCRALHRMMMLILPQKLRL